MKLTIRHVVIQHRTFDAVVHTNDNHTHRIGHLPAEGWFCQTCGKRCRQIAAVRAVVPPMEGRPEP